MDSSLEMDILSREDYIFERDPQIMPHSDFSTEKSIHEWIDSLRNRLVLFTFVQTFGIFYESTGRDIARQTHITASKKLEWLADTVDLDAFLLPFLVFRTREWKQRFQFKLYHSLFLHVSAMEDFDIAILVQCASYILENNNQCLLGIDEFFAIIDHLFAHMLTTIDWDILDLLYRLSQSPSHSDYQLRPHHIDALHEFIRSQRYVPSSQSHRHRRLGHSDFVHDDDVENFLIVEHQDIPVHPFSKNVYTDFQNVHSTGISQSIMSNILVLYNDYHDKASKSSLPQIFAELRRRLEREGIYTQELETGLQRIRTDPASFRLSDTIITKPRDVFMYVYLYSNEQSIDIQKELLHRFAEEIQEANGTCASGHITRILNILVGFHPHIHLSISEKEHAIVVLQRVLQEQFASIDDDEVLHAMTLHYSPDNAFVKWCQLHRQILLNHMKNRGIENEMIVHDAWNQLFPQFTDLLYSKQGCWRRWSCFCWS